MKLIIVLSVLATAYGANLKVTWGVPIPFIRTDFLTDVPTREEDLVAKNWVLTERPDDKYLPQLKLYCQTDDVTFCVLIDELGYIAGYQIALDKTKITKLYTPDLTKLQFISWSESRTGAEYWTQQLYFESQESYNQTLSTRIATRNSKAILPEDGVYVRDLDGTMLRISNQESDIKKSVFTKQACIPAMGQHYFYKMDKNADCNEAFSWFILTQGGKMIGMGFSVIGKWEQTSGKRMWFETPGVTALKLIINNGSQCVYDLAADPGMISMHVFFDVNPLPITVFC